MENHRALGVDHKQEPETAQHAEREQTRLDMWDARSKYYEHCDEQSAQFEHMTSPRFYAESNRMIAERQGRSENPEEDSKKAPHRQAEVALCDQWSRDDPHVRDSHRKHYLAENKPSWMHQQVGKNRGGEQPMTHSVNAQPKVNKQDEGHFKKEQLEQHMDQLRQHEEEAKRLQQEEEFIHRKRLQLVSLHEQWDADEKKRSAQKIVLDNQRFVQRKMQLRVEQVLQNLEDKKLFMERLKALDLLANVHNEEKRAEIQRGMDEFVDLVAKLKDVETKRKQHLQLIFDSEAAQVYGEYEASWQSEEETRRNIVQRLLTDSRQQIEDHLHLTQEHQRQLSKERQEMLQTIQALHVQEEDKKDDDKEAKCKEHEKMHSEEAQNASISHGHQKWTY